MTNLVVGEGPLSGNVQTGIESCFVMSHCESLMLKWSHCENWMLHMVTLWKLNATYGHTVKTVCYIWSHCVNWMLYISWNLYFTNIWPHTNDGGNSGNNRLLIFCCATVDEIQSKGQLLVQSLQMMNWAYHGRMWNSPTPFSAFLFSSHLYFIHM